MFIWRLLPATCFFSCRCAPPHHHLVPSVPSSSHPRVCSQLLLCLMYLPRIFLWLEPSGYQLSVPSSESFASLGLTLSATLFCHFCFLLGGILWWLRWWRICLQCWRPGFNPRVGKTPLDKEMATHSSILAWRIPWTEPASYSPRGRKESDTTEGLNWTELSLTLASIILTILS